MTRVLRTSLLGGGPITAVVSLLALNQSQYESHRNSTMVKLLRVVPQAGYKLRLEYDDGTIGDVDVSAWIGKGVFQALTDTEVFESVTVGEHGEVRWNDELELCADSLYLQMTGKSVEDLFPNLRAHVDA